MPPSKSQGIPQLRGNVRRPGDPTGLEAIQLLLGGVKRPSLPGPPSAFKAAKASGLPAIDPTNTVVADISEHKMIPGEGSALLRAVLAPRPAAPTGKKPTTRPLPSDSLDTGEVGLPSVVDAESPLAYEVLADPPLLESNPFTSDMSRFDGPEFVPELLEEGPLSVDLERALAKQNKMKTLLAAILRQL